MSSPVDCGEKVVLVHGTFANDDRPRARRWWQENSYFWKWLNVRFEGKASCQEMFEWSGKNWERDRRRAGKRLLKRVLEHESAGQSYHLIGHSHGGSVIWNALRLAARRGKPLNGLKSWTTVGTPFFVYRPKRGDILFAIPLALGLWFAPQVVAQMVLTAQSAGAMLSAGENWTFLGLAAVWAIWFYALLFSGFRVGALAWGWFARWRERRADSIAFRCFGERWLGLWSPEDEAILGLRSTVALDLRDLRDPSGKPLKILSPKMFFVPLIGSRIASLGDRLVFEWLRRFLQGNDLMSLKLAAVCAGPLPEVAQLPLPPEIHHELVRRVARDIVVPETLQRVRQLLGDVAFGGRFFAPDDPPPADRGARWALRFKQIRQRFGDLAFRRPVASRDPAPGAPSPDEQIPPRASVFNSILIHTLYFPEKDDQVSALLVADKVAQHIAKHAGITLAPDLILASARAANPAVEPPPASLPARDKGSSRERTGHVWRRFDASTPVQRAWTYVLFTTIGVMTLAADAFFDRVRQYTPEYQVNRVLNDAPVDDVGALPGEIAGADALTPDGTVAGRSVEPALAAWCRSLYMASDRADTNQTGWRSWARLPSAKVAPERAERAVARIEDPYTRANALAAIAGMLAAKKPELAVTIAGEAHAEAGKIVDPADRVETLGRIAAIYGQDDAERAKQVRESIQVAMSWLEERKTFREQNENLQKKNEEQAPAPAAPPAPSVPAANRRPSTALRVRMASQRRPQDQNGPPANSSAPTSDDVRGRYDYPPRQTNYVYRKGDFLTQGFSLNLTPANAQKLILGVVQSIALLSEAEREAAQTTAKELEKLLEQIEKTPNAPPSNGAPSKATVLGERSISVLDLSESSLVHLAALNRKLGVGDRRFEAKLPFFADQSWSIEPQYAERSDALLAEVESLRELDRVDEMIRFAQGSLAAQSPRSNLVAVTALADDLVRAANLFVTLDRKDLASQAVSKARGLLGDIRPSQKMIWQRDWVELDDLRDNRQSIIDGCILFRIRVRIGLADLLLNPKMDRKDEAAALLKEAWDDALTIGVKEEKGRLVKGSIRGTDRRIAALAEVIAYQAGTVLVKQVMTWLETLKKDDAAFSVTLLKSKEAGRALRRVARHLLDLGDPAEAMKVADLMSSKSLQVVTRLDVADWYVDPDRPSLIKSAKRARKILEEVGDDWKVVEYDLRLMSSVNELSHIPAEGKNLIIVASVDKVLHFRIFNADGKRVVDTDEKRLTEQAEKIKDFRKLLESLWPRLELTWIEKGGVITAVTSIVGHIPAVEKRRDQSLLASRVATLWAHLGDTRTARLACEKSLAEDRLVAYAAILDATPGGFSHPAPASQAGPREVKPRPRPALERKERELAFQGLSPEEILGGSFRPATPSAPISDEPLVPAPVVVYAPPPPPVPELAAPAPPEPTESPATELSAEDLELKKKISAAEDKVRRSQDLIQQKLAYARKLTGDVEKKRIAQVAADRAAEVAADYQMDAAVLKARKDAKAKVDDKAKLLRQMNDALEAASAATKDQLQPARQELADLLLEQTHRADRAGIDAVRKRAFQDAEHSPGRE
jgi:hypothetical protein